ncbi:hypothetical protein ABS772_17705 [Methylorubrum podarium]|uniref:Uncharacterized protein n=1 Tax=Methylorubrum podarium TaxID=200476 RepID=A0ABV1QQW4_9HYPH
MSTVIPFFRPASARQGNWSQQELAEFYRVEAALLRAGFSIASEHGLSDEGEPWFVFCRPDGDAIIHFAKIDGSYLIASEALDRPVRGTDFRTLIDQIARLHPHLLPIPATGTGTTLVVHPAALLAALVAAAALSLSSEDAHAGPLLPGGEGVSAPPASEGGGPAQGQPQPKATGGSGDRDTDRKQLEAIILSAMIFAAEAMAVDHRAVSAELNLDFADGAGNASSPTPQGDTTLAPGTALGYGRGGVSVQPAVLTAQGSGANPDPRPQSASDTIAVSSRVDSAPVARIEFASEAPKSPTSQNQPLAPGFGSDVAPTGTSAEASAAKSGGQQASTSGRSESAAPASDESGPASIAEPPSHARPAHAASSDSANAGNGPARPVSGNAVPQTVTDRVLPAEASRDDDDRGHGRQAEVAVGDNPKADQAKPGNGPVNAFGRDRASPAVPAAEDNPNHEQAGPGNSHARDVSHDRGSPTEAAAENGSQAERDNSGNGRARTFAEARGSQAEATPGSSPQAELSQPGKGHASGDAWEVRSSARAAHGNGSQVEKSGRGGSPADGAASDQSLQAEATAESNPPVEQSGGGEGHRSSAGQDRGARIENMAGNNPPAEQADPSDSRHSGVDQGRGPQNEAATRNNPQLEQVNPGKGHADATGQSRKAPTEAAIKDPSQAERDPHVEGQASSAGPTHHSPAAAASDPQVEPTGPTSGSGKKLGHDRGSSPESAAGDQPATDPPSRGKSHVNDVSQDNEPSVGPSIGGEPQAEQDVPRHGRSGGIGENLNPHAKAAAGNEPQIERSGGQGNGRIENFDQDRGSRNESVSGGRFEAEQIGRGEGREHTDGQGLRRPTETSSESGVHLDQAGGGNGHNDGGSSHGEAAAHRNTGSGSPVAGHGRTPSNGADHGSAVQPETNSGGPDHQVDRVSGHDRALAEGDGDQEPDARGPGAIDPSSDHRRPEAPGEARSDAAPITKAHATLDLDSAAHGPTKLSATKLPGGVREPTDGAAPEHATAAGHASATADGPARDPTSSPSEHPRGNSIGHDSDHASNAAVSELTSGDVSGTREHESSPSDVAVTSPSTVHVGGTGSQAKLAQEESAPHGQSADGEPAIPASAARDPVSQDRGSDRAEAENPLRHAASPASDAQFASPKGEHAEAGPDGSHDGAGPVVDRAIPAADPQAMVHGVDENGLPDPSGGPNRTSPPASISQDETASAHFDRGQVDDAPSVSGRGDREAPGQAAHPVKTEPPTEPPVEVEAGLADGLSPSGQSGSEASHGASHGASGQTKPGRPSPPPAAIDADGNLVFHTDAHQDSVPSAPPHGPDEATTHHAVGLIGVSDQAHPVHDMYHHT